MRRDAGHEVAARHAAGAAVLEELGGEHREAGAAPRRRPGRASTTTRICTSGSALLTIVATRSPLGSSAQAGFGRWKARAGPEGGGASRGGCFGRGVVSRAGIATPARGGGGASAAQPAPSRAAARARVRIEGARVTASSASCGLAGGRALRRGSGGACRGLVGLGVVARGEGLHDRPPRRPEVPGHRAPDVVLRHGEVGGRARSRSRPASPQKSSYSPSFRARARFDWRPSTIPASACRCAFSTSASLGPRVASALISASTSRSTSATSASRRAAGRGRRGRARAAPRPRP